MNAISQKVLLGALIGLAAIGWWTSAKVSKPTEAKEPETPATASTPSYRVTGPFSHENLSIFLLHAAETLTANHLKTLDEALNGQSFIVHETGTVNTLMVENRSDDDVLILPGDIVKGGRQDRLIGSAVLVPAKSGMMAVPSFCVEQGRWSQRGGEVATRFSMNDRVIAGQGLKNAALVKADQGEVWENVKALQGGLSRAVKQEVADKQSATSLQLSLENRAVIEKLSGYQEKLGNILLGAKSAIGFVIVVNGEVSSAEVFGNSAVLNKAWPKMLQAAAVEALAGKTDKPFAPQNVEAVMAFLADAEKGQLVASASQPGLSRGIQDNLQNDLQRSQQLETGPSPQGFQQLQDAVQDSRSNIMPSSRATGRAWSLNNVREENVNVQAAPVDVSRRMGANCVVVESRDQNRVGTVIHRSFVAKK
jgi:hypothetical protein